MNEEYQIEMQERQALYFKLFRKEYKNYKKFRNRKKMFLALVLVYIFFCCFFYTIDAMSTGTWENSFFVVCLYIFLGGGYVLPRVLNWLNEQQLYQEYWKLRKCLYEENIYIEKIIFSCQGIRILGYDREKKVSDFVTYQNANQMSFYKTGIILRPNGEEYIYIPRELFRNREDLKQIKKWYEENNGYGETSL